MPRPHKNSKTGVYYFRQKTPADLREKFGKAEAGWTLETKVESEAIIRNAEAVLKQAKVWQSLRAAPSAIPHKQIMALVGEYRRQLDTMLDEEPGEVGIWDSVLKLQTAKGADPIALEKWQGKEADALLLAAGLREAGTSEIDCLTKDQFGRALADTANFSRESESGVLTRCLPPDDLVKYLYNCRDLPLPYLSTLTRAPTMGKDYTINTTPGYSTTGYVYYSPPSDLYIPPLPKVVTEENLAKARQLIVEEWLGDFPFDGWTRDQLVKAALGGDMENPPPPSLLNTIGIALEQIVCPIIEGVLPPHVFTKPSSRTGATNLANSIQMVIEGSTSSMTLEADEASMEKKIVSHLKASTAVALLDNVSGTVDSPLIAKWWTDPTFSGRDLGKSKMLNLPVRHSKIATTNNAGFSRELANRLGYPRDAARQGLETEPRNGLYLA